LKFTTGEYRVNTRNTIGRVGHLLVPRERRGLNRNTGSVGLPVPGINLKHLFYFVKGLLAFNSNVPFAHKLECPLRKGQRNGSAKHEQRGIESFGSDGAFAGETDGTKNS
jgi:hypothetical protein